MIGNLLPASLKRSLVKKLPKWLAPARLKIAREIAPLSSVYANDRGTPIHRYYLHQFLKENRTYIQGHCLEFQDPDYTRNFGSNVTKLDVVDLSADNPKATIVCDLTKPDHPVPHSSVDCVTCTHVLHIVYEKRAFLKHIHDVLKPGGVLLLVVPAVSMIHQDYPELWRFTPLGIEELLKEAFPGGEISVTAYGNSLAAAAEIRGMAAEEYTSAELDTRDPRFPVEVCARARKAL